METIFVLDALKVIGYGVATFGPALGIGIAAYGLCSAAARQPEIKGQLMTYFIVGAAMIEAMVLFGFLLCLIV